MFSTSKSAEDGESQKGKARVASKGKPDSAYTPVRSFKDNAATTPCWAKTHLCGLALIEYSCHVSLLNGCSYQAAQLLFLSMPVFQSDYTSGAYPLRIMCAVCLEQGRFGTSVLQCKLFMLRSASSCCSVTLATNVSVV